MSGEDCESCVVWAHRSDGTMNYVKVIDLDEESFRKWVICILLREGIECLNISDTRGFSFLERLRSSKED